MQFQQIGIVHTHMEIEVNNQSYSHASATAVSRHTPLLKKNEVLYKGRYELKISGSLSFFSIGLPKAIFTLRENSGFKRTITKVEKVYRYFF